MAYSAPFPDTFRPMAYQRGRYAAFVYPVLVEPERRIRQIGPGDAIALVGILRSRHDAGIVAKMNIFACARAGLRNHELVDELIDGHALGNIFGARSIVRQEND